MLKNTIERAWEDRELLKEKEVQEAIYEVVAQLDSGALRVAQMEQGAWQVNDWVKKAVILYFPIRQMESVPNEPFRDMVEDQPSRWSDQITVTSE